MAFDQLRFRVALKKLNNLSRTLADLGNMVVQVSANPTKLGALGAAIHVGGNFIANQMESFKSTPPWPKTVMPIHLDLSDVADPDLPGLFHIGGQRVYVPPKKSTYLYYVEHDVQAFHEWVRDREWKSCTQLVVRRNDTGAMELVSDSTAAEITSPRTEEFWGRIKPCLDAGEARSVLLDGPPGVGKSTAARVLVSRVGGRRLRLILDENSSTNWLQTMVEFLQPSTIVIDDFDRLGTTAMDLLDFLERCRNTIKLLVVTSNNVGNLDLAVVRPGRFDEVFPMVSLGSDYLRPQVGDALWAALTEDQRHALADWPAAHIHELRIRHTHLTCDLNVEFEDLAERVRKNRQVEPGMVYETRRRSITPTASTSGDDDDDDDGDYDDSKVSRRRA